MIFDSVGPESLKQHYLNEIENSVQIHQQNNGQIRVLTLMTYYILIEVKHYKCMCQGE